MCVAGSSQINCRNFSQQATDFDANANVFKEIFPLEFMCKSVKGYANLKDVTVSLMLAVLVDTNNVQAALLVVEGTKKGTR